MVAVSVATRKSATQSGARRESPRVPSEHRLAATAHHEAGHAVVGLLLGLRERVVTIRPNRRQGTLGRCRAEALETTRLTLTVHDQDRLERAVVSLLAGGAAEARFLGHPNPDGAAQDRWDAARFLARIVQYTNSAEDAPYDANAIESPDEDGGDPEYMGRLRGRAEKLVRARRNWGAIRKLAAELLREETIRGEARIRQASGLLTAAETHRATGPRARGASPRPAR